ncbi:MAG TPA: tyrosine-type recombinase/integrase [Vicinamibacterales bacterium]
MIAASPSLASLLQRFFTERLVRQQRASPHTIASYRDAFRLLLRFAQERLGRVPSSLALDDLDAAFIAAFLDHVEHHRGNTPRTRNVRLAAIHAFCHYVAVNEPAHLDRCRRILAIPVKRYERRPIAYLTRAEIDALVAAPDVATWIGRRDQALLLLAIQTGLRVSELIHLRCGDIVLGTGAHLRCEGKGRKHRCTPLRREMVRLLTAWLRERNGDTIDPLFSTARGTALSRDAVERLVARHAKSAQDRCPSLNHKRVSPHVLRHTAAMELLGHGVDRAVIALWLGHESVETTQMYLHADLRLKEQVLARTTPADVKPGRYRPSDQLLAFLERL